MKKLSGFVNFLLLTTLGTVGPALAQSEEVTQFPPCFQQQGDRILSIDQPEGRIATFRIDPEGDQFPTEWIKEDPQWYISSIRSGNGNIIVQAIRYEWFGPGEPPQAPPETIRFSCTR